MLVRPDVSVAGHPGHDQYPGGQREQQYREDEKAARVGRGHRRGGGLGADGPAGPGKIGHQPVDMALGLRLEGRVDPLGQLVEGQPSRHEMLAQLEHGRITLGVADPDVVVIPGPAGHPPPRHQLFPRLFLVRVLVHPSGSDVISPCHRLPGFARLARSHLNDKSRQPSAEAARGENHDKN